MAYRKRRYRKVKRSVVNTRSRHGSKRGSTIEARYKGGKRTLWSFLLFPRLRARARGARWADPRRR
jgi:hypothetical protein